jgi:hypothetical protein
MKYLLLLVFFAGVMPSAMAQKKKKKAADQSSVQTVIADSVVFPETNYDFGKIPQGKPVYHFFTVQNVALDTLKIENVQTSCGCTTPEYDKAPVLKGGKLDIKVGYNAANEGNFEKSITVTYNGGQSKQLFIRGNVWKTPDQSVPGNGGLKNF